MLTRFLFSLVCSIFKNMHPFIVRLLTEQSKKRKKDPNDQISDYVLMRELKRLRLRILQLLKSTVLLVMGVGSASIGLLGFLLPNEVVDGGAVGIALLTAQVTSLSFPVLFFLISLPFLFFGYRLIGKGFTIKAATSIILLSVSVAVIEIPIITEDKLLVSVFGGFFLGLGIGLVMRGGGVLDGTEILALALTRKLGLTVGDLILVFNIIIFSVAAYLLSIETALYSMLTYLAASRTVDFILEGIEEYTGVTIISPKSEEIREMITAKLGHGVTVYRGKRGFGSHGHRQTEIDILYSVVTRLEISRLTAEIQLIDKDAFVMMQSVKDTRGGMIRKRAHQHI